MLISGSYYSPSDRGPYVHGDSFTSCIARLFVIRTYTGTSVMSCMQGTSLGFQGISLVPQHQVAAFIYCSKKSTSWTFKPGLFWTYIKRSIKTYVAVACGYSMKYWEQGWKIRVELRSFLSLVVCLAGIFALDILIVKVW